MLRKTLALIAIAIPLTLVACGGSDSSSSTTAASGAGASSTTAASTTESGAGGGSGGSGGGVAISESEFQLDPSQPTAKAGSVTFDIKNDGTIVHDLQITGNGVDESTNPIGAGGSAKLTVDLKPGTYQIFCNIDSHRQQGMEGTLTVR